MDNIKVFVDSDVIISSLISNKGASYQLINIISTEISFYISNYSVSEIKLANKKLAISDIKTARTFAKLNLLELKSSSNQIKKIYNKYTLDRDDSHIVAGTFESKCKFLITYNLKHYDIEKIKRDFGINVMSPGIFLQYLRGRTRHQVEP